MKSRSGTLARVAVGLVVGCGGNAHPARPAASMDEEIAQLRAGGHVRARSGAAPCRADDEAGCERLCAGGDGWACANAADAHVARGDVRGAAPLYIAACERRDPLGCIGASLNVARDRTLAPSFPMRYPIGSYALMIVACERVPEPPPGAPAGIEGDGPFTVAAEVNAAFCREFLAAIYPDERACKLWRDSSACRRVADREAVAAAEADARAAAERAADEKARADQVAAERAEQAAREAASEEADRALREAQREEEELALAQGRERVRVAREALRAGPEEGAGRLSRGDCESIVIEICERMKVQGRRSGIPENEIEDAAIQCREDNSALVSFCEGVRCGPRWRRCMIDESMTRPEWDACSRFADSC